MKPSVKVGLSFGLTSGIIATLGIIMGLNAGTHSRLAVIGGIITIAIADAFSDSFGIHVTEEAKNVHSAKEIWESTVSTFAFKFIFAISFLFPVLLLDLMVAIYVSIVWGLSLICVFSYQIASARNASKWKTIGEHLLIACIVIVVTHFVGTIVATTFG